MREQSYFNHIITSIEFGVYPSKLKHAKVVPIYKGEDETHPRNYSPNISTLCFSIEYSKKRFIIRNMRISFHKAHLWKSVRRDPFNQNSNRSDREKRTTSKGGPVFSKLFRLDRTDPLSLGPKFPEILVEWIAPSMFIFTSEESLYSQSEWRTAVLTCGLC